MAKCWSPKPEFSVRIGVPLPQERNKKVILIGLHPVVREQRGPKPLFQVRAAFRILCQSQTGFLVLSAFVVLRWLKTAHFCDVWPRGSLTKPASSSTLAVRPVLLTNGGQCNASTDTEVAGEHHDR